MKAVRALLLACVGIVGTLQAGAQENSEHRQPSEERAIDALRSQWFYGQRAYPHKFVPAGAFARASAARDAMAAQDLARGRTGTALNWALIGPRPIDTPYTDPVVAGRVAALAVDPTSDATVYLGGAQGGVWKTTNGGTSWSPLTDSETSLAIGSLAIDPTDHMTIYAGTGEENFSGDSYYGAGILKSTNGGKTWKAYCGPFCGPVSADGYYGGGARIGNLAIDPANTKILLAGVALVFEDGVYRSTDGGSSWTQVLSGDPGTAVLFDPSNGKNAFAALSNSFTGGTVGVYSSTDSGLHWKADNGTGANALPLTNAGRIVLAMVPSAPTTLFASIANVNDGSLLGVFRTTDSGAHWSQLSLSDFCTPQCSYDNAIAVDPADADIVYAGGAFETTLERSLDGGNSWSVLQSAQSGGFLHADMHALAFTPDGSTLYLGNDGGAYSTTQIDATTPAFTGLNQTLAVTQFYPGMSIDPANAAIALVGSQDNGTDLYSGVMTWKQVTCGDGSYTAIDPVKPAVMYAACQQYDIQKSTARGTAGSWTTMQTGVNTADRIDFIPPLAMDPEKPTTLYFGTYRIYQTTNSATSWKAISPDLTNGPAFWGVVTAIAVAPSNSQVVYAATGDGNVQVTANAGHGAAATWTKVASGLPPRVATALAVHPTTPSTAYVTFSGFTGFGDSLGHVFMTANRGANWTDISGNLPNTPVNTIAINAAKPNQIFIGTDVGVYYTDDGVTWTTLGQKLPHVAVLGLTYHAASQTLRASTHGRGVWDINLAGLP